MKFYRSNFLFYLAEKLTELNWIQFCYNYGHKYICMFDFMTRPILIFHICAFLCIYYILVLLDLVCYINTRIFTYDQMMIHYWVFINMSISYTIDIIGIFLRKNILISFVMGYKQYDVFC